MQYTINKAEKTKAMGDKQRLIVIGGITLVVALIAVIFYMVYKNAAHPNTYEELMPLMDDAMAFDQKIADISRPYESIEEQVGEEAYFQAIEKDYVGAVEKQQQVIEEIDRVEAIVAEMGGITSHEDLQRVKQPATDSFIAQEYEKKYGSGYVE